MPVDHLIEVYDLMPDKPEMELIKKKNVVNKILLRFIMKVLELHKKQIEWWKNKLGIDDYAVAWIAFIKGLIVGTLITYYINN